MSSLVILFTSYFVFPVIVYQDHDNQRSVVKQADQVVIEQKQEEQPPDIAEIVNSQIYKTKETDIKKTTVTNLHPLQIVIPIERRFQPNTLDYLISLGLSAWC